MQERINLPHEFLIFSNRDIPWEAAIHHVKSLEIHVTNIKMVFIGAEVDLLSTNLDLGSANRMYKFRVIAKDVKAIQQIRVKKTPEEQMSAQCFRCQCSYCSPQVQGGRK